MPAQTISDASTTYIIGVAGSVVGTMNGVDLIAILSGVLITARFTYDSVRFYYFVKDRKHNKTIKKKE